MLILGCVHFSANSNEKSLQIQNGCVHFINLQHTVASSTYSPGHNFSFLMRDISIRGRQGWKVTAKMYNLEVR